MRSPCCYVSVCFPLIVVKQRHDKHVTAATNTYATIEELMEESFSMRSISYQSKVSDVLHSAVTEDAQSGRRDAETP
jgi:hypothetical protein